MSTADKIGLLPGFGWIAGNSFWMTLVICWLITPGLMFVIAAIGESRLLPWKPSEQFLSFFPGDFFLGTMLALLLWFAQRLPSEDQFYNSAWFHFVVLTVTFAVAVIITRGEYNDPNGYGHRAILSPTKLYHNILLYGAYGYVIIVTLVAVVSWLIMKSEWSQSGILALCLIPGLIWVSLMVLEQKVSEETKQNRVNQAHVNDWEPIWQH